MTVGNTLVVATLASLLTPHLLFLLVAIHVLFLPVDMVRIFAN